jgi:DNA-binding GntR family transcriptional regulator
MAQSFYTSSLLEPMAPGAAPTTLRAHVVKVLRDKILSGHYKSGDRLNESLIARELEVSRIPVREALSHLRDQGLVMYHPRRGMFVTQLGAEEVQQINSLRIVLETEALRLARARMTPEILNRLTQLVEQMEAWNGSLFDAATLDLEFHQTIWRATGNPHLEKCLVSLTTQLFAHKALEHISQEIRRWRLNHHRALLDVVAAPQPQDAQSAILTHLRMAYTEPERFSSLAVQGPPAAPQSAHNRRHPGSVT